MKGLNSRKGLMDGLFTSEDRAPSRRIKSAAEQSLLEPQLGNRSSNNLLFQEFIMCYKKPVSRLKPGMTILNRILLPSHKSSLSYVNMKPFADLQRFQPRLPSLKESTERF